MTADLKLPGRRHLRLIGGREELWLREDHLLCVRHSSFFESYQRFYYRDIESLVLVPTRRIWLIELMFSGVLLCLSLFFVGLVPLAALGLGAGSLWLVFTLANFSMGPTCKTVLRTRINTRELTELCRVRPARKALALLSARIREAQANEPAAGGEESPPPLAEPATLDVKPPTISVEPVRAVVTASPPLPPLPPERPSFRSHIVLAIITGGQALLSFNAAFLPEWPLGAAVAGVMLVASLAGLCALIQQRRQPTPAALRKACGWTSAFHFTSMYGVLMLVGMLQGVHTQQMFSFDGLGMTYHRLVAEHAVAQGLLVGYAALAFLLTVWLAGAVKGARRT